MATMKVVLKGGDFADQTTEWRVPDELLNAYSTFWAGWVAKGLVESAIALSGINSADEGNEKLLSKAG
jgi:hypothetical protein